MEKIYPQFSILNPHLCFYRRRVNVSPVRRELSSAARRAWF